MLYAMLAASAILIFVLAVPRAAEARHLARLFRAQEEWAEALEDDPNGCCFYPFMQDDLFSSIVHACC